MNQIARIEPHTMAVNKEKKRESDKSHSGIKNPRSIQLENSVVLIVDDIPELCEALATMLEMVGYKVITTNNIENALSELSARPEIDIMLTDLALAEGRSGYDLSLRAKRMRPNLCVIVMSGFPEGHCIPQELDGQFQLLRKPFELNELINAISKATSLSVRPPHIERYLDAITNSNRACIPASSLIRSCGRGSHV